MRHLLLALIVITLVFRVGTACEAMAATASAPATHQAHCADMPTKPDKPLKPDAPACAFCIALPGAMTVGDGVMHLVALAPVASLSPALAGLASGPTPPPPRIA